jgi:hypothetical protein
MKNISGYFFWFSNEVPHKFFEALIDVIVLKKSEGCSVFSESGVTKRKLADVGLLSGVRLVSGRGKYECSDCSCGNLVFSYEPSPLSIQYGALRKDGLSLVDVNKNQKSYFYSIESIVGYVLQRDLKEYPNFFWFSMVVSDEVDVCFEALLLAEKFINSELDSVGGGRWLGVLDVSPMEMMPMAGKILLGRNEAIAHRLDRYMLAPSFIVVGSLKTISDYYVDVNLNFPGNAVLGESRGGFVVLKDINLVKKIFLPKWHLSHR